MRISIHYEHHFALTYKTERQKKKEKFQNLFIKLFFGAKQTLTYKRF